MTLLGSQWEEQCSQDIMTNSELDQEQAKLLIASSIIVTSLLFQEREATDQAEEQRVYEKGLLLKRKAEAAILQLCVIFISVLRKMMRVYVM